MTQQHSWSTSQIPAINPHLLSAEKADHGSGSHGVLRSPLMSHLTSADLQSRAGFPSGISCLICAQGVAEITLNSHSQAPHRAGAAVSALLPHSLTGTSALARLLHPRDAPHSSRLHHPWDGCQQSAELTGDQEKPGCHRAPRQSREQVRGQDKKCLPTAMPPRFLTNDTAAALMERIRKTA